MYSKDFLVEVAFGNIAGYSLMHKFGRNANVPNGLWAVVSSSGPSGVFPMSGIPVRIKTGGNIADTIDGPGAREIVIIGIDTNLEEISESIITSGVNASLYTSSSFWRIYRAYVSSVGTYGGANVGNIIIENSEDMLVITAEEGQTQHAAYSIPAGKTGYLLSIRITVDANKPADCRLFTRENFNQTEDTISSVRLKISFDGVLGQVHHAPLAPSTKLKALSDIWVEARGGGANTEVSVDFEILLIDDPSGPIRRV